MTQRKQAVAVYMRERLDELRADPKREPRACAAGESSARHWQKTRRYAGALGNALCGDVRGNAEPKRTADT